MPSLTARLGPMLDALLPRPTDEDDRPLPDPAAVAGLEAEQPDAACARCGISVGPGETTATGCGRCRGRLLAWDGFVRLGPWASPLDRWLRTGKYQGLWGLYPPLGQQLAHRIAGRVDLSGPTVVIPVPMHALRRLGRGYNQAALLARAVARTGRWTHVNGLCRTKWTRRQAGLAATERRRNPGGSIRTRGIDFSGWTVVVVDDVKTTGATMERCARALRRAGAARIIAATVAVADPPG